MRTWAGKTSCKTVFCGHLQPFLFQVHEVVQICWSQEFLWQKKTQDFDTKTASKLCVQEQSLHARVRDIDLERLFKTNVCWARISASQHVAMAVSRTCKAKQIISLLCVALFLDAACTFVGLSTRGAHASLPRSRVAVKSLTPPEIQLPFMDAPIPGATFALYCGGALVLVCLFGAYQLWRLFFSRELGTYAEIKWGGARPPKEYVDEMKKLEARRKRKFLRSVTDLWGRLSVV